MLNDRASNTRRPSLMLFSVAPLLITEPSESQLAHVSPSLSLVPAHAQKGTFDSSASLHTSMRACVRVSVNVCVCPAHSSAASADCNCNSFRDWRVK